MKTSRIIIVLSLLVVFFSIGASARSNQSARTGASVTSARSYSSYRGSGYRAFSSYRGRGYSGRSGFQRNAYRSGYRGGYHGYYGYGGGGYGWPYWYDYTPSIGGFVAYLPDDYVAVDIGGITYYYGDGYFYSPYSTGYEIVPTPPENPTESTAPEAQPQTSPEGTALASPAPETGGQSIAGAPKSASADTATINVPNSNGGFTPVRLIKYKNGYIGPQGEFYAGHPTVDALKALYGD